MAEAGKAHVFVPRWTWAAPVLVAVILALKYSGVLPKESALVLIAATALIGFCVFASVHHADQLAARVGEPFGSILLALAITVMEVAVILSVMAADTAGSDAVARDTVFAAVMIVLNGIVGLCLVVGGIRHHEQVFRTDGGDLADPAELYPDA
jgi:Ca2+:H+ antiporter